MCGSGHNFLAVFRGAAEKDRRAVSWDIWTMDGPILASGWMGWVRIGPMAEQTFFGMLLRGPESGLRSAEKSTRAEASSHVRNPVHVPRS
jgi:hypothetical protein